MLQLTETERATLDRRGFVIREGRIIRHDDLPDLAAQREAAAGARAAHLGRLDAQRAEERRQRDAALDAELADRRALEQARWLAANPGKTPADFAREAWPHVRAVLVAELAEAARRQTETTVRAADRYQL